VEHQSTLSEPLIENLTQFQGFALGPVAKVVEIEGGVISGL